MFYDMNVIERGVRGMFAKEFITRTRKAKYPLYCTVVNSDKKEEKFNAISTLPQMQEMTDERVLAGFSEYSYTLANKIYATGIRVPRQLFEFDQTGQLRTLVQSLGARVANFPDKLTYQVIGVNGNCYDGTAMFNASHDLGSGVTQSNILTGQIQDNDLDSGITSATTRDDFIAKIQADLRLAKARMFDFKDDRGEPWHDEIEPESLMVLCHPAMEWLMRTALEATQISATGNVSVKSVGKVVTTNYAAPFTYANNIDTGKSTWYLLKVDSPIMPFLFQRFGPKQDFQDAIPEADQSVLQALSTVEVQSVMRSGRDIDSQTFFNDEYLFGARVVQSVGYGMWQNAVKVIGAAS